MTDQTLTEFLLARIAEDEQDAQSMLAEYPEPWEIYDRGHTARVMADAPKFHVVTELSQDYCDAPWLGHVIAHIARQSPARTLRAVAAKRAVLARHHAYAGKLRHPKTPRWCEGCNYEYSSMHEATENIEECPELRDMASVYEGHPEFRSEWKTS